MLHYQLYEYNPNAPLVVLTHGLGEYGLLYEPLFKPFHEAGLSILLYDVQGHGQNGTRGWLKQYTDLIVDLKEIIQQNRRTRKVYLMGHSMGAMISHLYALTEFDIDGVISIGYQYYKIPAVKFMGFWMPKRRLKLNWADPRSRHTKSLSEIEDPALLDSVSFKLLYETIHKANAVVRKNLSQYTVPVLVIHGGEDQIVPLKNAYALYHQLPNAKEMIVYPHSYHDALLDIDQAIVLKDILDWILQH